MLKIGQKATVEITGYTSEGLGVCRIDGCAVFVPNAIRGEVCEVAVSYVSRNSAQAKLTKLLEPSAHRMSRRLCPDSKRCGGYERVETLRALEGRVDVWLPDMKYSDPGLARVLSAAPDYVEVAKAAISEMYRQTGPCVVEDGLLRRGVLIRHLILPGQVDNSIGVLEWIAKTFPKGAVLVSLMSQYVPMGPAAKVPPFDRRITREEYDTVLSWMYLLGLDAGFLQGPEAASLEYVPEFDGTGILKRSKAPNEG